MRPGGGHGRDLLEKPIDRLLVEVCEEPLRNPYRGFAGRNSTLREIVGPRGGAVNRDRAPVAPWTGAQRMQHDLFFVQDLPEVEFEYPRRLGPIEPERPSIEAGGHRSEEHTPELQS